MKQLLLSAAGVIALAAVVNSAPGHSDGKKLFQQETFGGNGRTCQTCHSDATGTVSPQDAAKRFLADPNDPLFVHDGSDDGQGHGVTRMLSSATVLVTIPLPPNVKLADDPAATSVTLRRGIPTLFNTPALDPVLMLDGRQPSLEDQAMGAIRDHAQNILAPSAEDLHNIAEFQKTNQFFSSPAFKNFANGKAAPGLPQGRTASEKRGRVFFEDLPPNPAEGFRPGLCAHCHSGPLQNMTNEFVDDFIAPGIPAGLRFFSIGVSEFNTAGNPVRNYIVNPGPGQVVLPSPDPGRALVTGQLQDFNSFKISPLPGIRNTAPYFHDNSAKTLEDVAAHYANFFRFVTGGVINLTLQDEKDMVAYMKLLD
jgi:cytochrome c peroxidase